jgi:hypothetical protein
MAAVKTIVRVEEEDDEGITTIREKEQFSHSLNLLYCTGETAVLTSDPPVDDEQASEKAVVTTAPAEGGRSRCAADDGPEIPYRGDQR